MKQIMIPYGQALKLAQWRASFAEITAAIQSVQQRIEDLRRRLLAAHDFADIPVDRNVSVRLEDYDGKGTVPVEWEENS